MNDDRNARIDRAMSSARKAHRRGEGAKHKTGRIWATIVSLACVCPQALPAVARAQTQPGAAQSARPGAPTDALTLPVAVDIALRTNPMIRATASGQELASAQIGEARASRYPLVQFSETFARSNNPVFVFGSLLEQGRFGPQNFDVNALNNPDSLSNFRTSMTFRFPIFDQRQSGTRINRAQIGRQQADLQAEFIKQQIRFEVLKAYYGMLVARGKKEAADEAATLAEADVKRSGDMFDTGLVVQSDLLAAEVQLAEFRQQQIQTQGDLTIAQAGLNTALGLSVDTPQKVAGELVDRRFNTVSQDASIRLAMEHRPELASARLAGQSAQEGVRGARGEFLPRLEVFGGFGMSAHNLTGGSSDYTVGASATFNIFDAGRKSRLAQAHAAENIAGANQEHLANQIRFEVVRAYQQYVSASERLNVALRAVEQAREALRIVQERYQAGLTTITEVLRAENTFVRARMTLLSARYDHYVGYAALLHATGTLTDVQPFVS
jgi:outer membrane protein